MVRPARARKAQCTTASMTPQRTRISRPAGGSLNKRDQCTLDTPLELAQRLPAPRPVLRTPQRQILVVVRLCPSPLRTQPELVHVAVLLRRPGEGSRCLNRPTQTARHQPIVPGQSDPGRRVGRLLPAECCQRPVVTVPLLLTVPNNEQADSTTKSGPEPTQARTAALVPRRCWVAWNSRVQDDDPGQRT